MKTRIVKRAQAPPVKRTSLPLLGKVKVGHKVKQGTKEYPQSLDYFVATGKYQSLFEKVYEKQNKLEVVFVHDDACMETYELRDKAGKLVAYGDGVEWMVWDTKTDSYQEKKTSIEEMEKKGKVDTVLTLYFLLPRVQGVMGVWQFTTKGAASSVPNIRDSYDMVQDIAGTVVNIPFDLQVEKVKSNSPGPARSYPVVNLVANISKENLEVIHEKIQEGFQLKGMLTDEYVGAMPHKQLPASIDEVSVPSAEEHITFAQAKALWHIIKKRIDDEEDHLTEEDVAMLLMEHGVDMNASTFSMKEIPVSAYEAIYTTLSNK